MGLDEIGHCWFCAFLQKIHDAQELVVLHGELHALVLVLVHHHTTTIFKASLSVKDDYI